MNQLQRLNAASIVATVLVCITAGSSVVIAQGIESFNSPAKLSEGATISREKKGISAQLMDRGDYYFHPDGHKIKFYRKKDVYLVNTKVSTVRRSSAASVDTAMQRVAARFGARVKVLKNHRLGSANVIRLDNSASIKAKNKQTYDIEPAMLQSLDSSILDLTPVLADAKGQGDITISSKLIIKLADDEDIQSNLDAVLKRFNLTLERRLKVSGAVFSVRSNRTQNTSDSFALVRNVMNDSRLSWAQPQFKARPYKTSFIPNDTLFDDQWHLRNTGQSGSRCDSDCDANNAWGIGSNVGEVSGENIVIAIVDDGVDLGHEDLTIWSNTGEIGGGKETNGIDDDNNGCIDDLNGCDFVDDSLTSVINPSADFDFCVDLLLSNPDPLDMAGQRCLCEDDGDTGKDSDPSPQATNTCLTIDNDVVEQDNHGTAVAGLAAAVGNNSTGVAGTAFSATVLPVRLISEFDGDSSSDFCARAAEAISYAGRNADVINNSWALDDNTCSPLLDTVITDTVNGTLMDGMTNISKRPNLGSPVIFASGNTASGWVKMTVPVTAGQHAFEWRFRRVDDYDPDNFSIDDEVRLDDITWPDGSVQGFEDFDVDIAGFTNTFERNSCDSFCDVGPIAGSIWVENTNLDFVHSGAASASMNMLNTDCSYNYLHTIKSGPAGEVSFWVWVSTLTDLDKFEFLVDGTEALSFGDIAAFGFVNNDVAYPANLAASIAVGASTSGDLSGFSTADPDLEKRAAYSQYGPELDFVAPSSDQHLAIITTDRSGLDGYAGDNYTNTFGGTSASAPQVAGIAAAMISANSALSAADIRSKLQQTADEIDSIGYMADRNQFYGHGRVNMYKALLSALGDAVIEPPAGSCAPEPFNYLPVNDLILPRYAPQPGDICPALGPMVEDDLCFPIPTSNGKVAVVCL